MATTRPGNGFILAKETTGGGGAEGNNMNYGIYINTRSHIIGGFETPDGHDYIPTSQSKYADNQWHPVASTYNGTVLSMFVDGRLEAANGTRGAIPDNSGNEFTLTIYVDQYELILLPFWGEE